MKKINTFAIMIFLLIFSGCNTNKSTIAEKKLKTGGNITKTFHPIVDDLNSPAHIINAPSYLIGVEKSPKVNIGAKSWGGYFSLGGMASAEENEFANNMLTGKEKSMFISHIVRYKNPHSFFSPDTKGNYLYNLYDKINKSPKQADVIASNSFKQGWDELRNLGQKIDQEVTNNGITHVFVFSLGWNTNQLEAIDNYNRLMGRFYKHWSKKANFKPLFIFFSWPSSWLQHDASFWKAPYEYTRLLFSYGTKADDADEVGMTAANILLHQTLIPLNSPTKRFRLILIGHSFGARVLSRSIFSASLLPGVSSLVSKDIDLFIGLQGGFSINRFIQGEGNEGSPYMRFSSHANKFLLTWSSGDTANPLARLLSGAEHSGGVFGFNESKKKKHNIVLPIVQTNFSNN